MIDGAAYGALSGNAWFLVFGMFLEMIESTADDMERDLPLEDQLAECRVLTSLLIFAEVSSPTVELRATLHADAVRVQAIADRRGFSVPEWRETVKRNLWVCTEAEMNAAKQGIRDALARGVRELTAHGKRCPSCGELLRTYCAACSTSVTR